MFDARIQIRSGTEACREDCEKCDKNKRKKQLGMKSRIVHDHCSTAPLTDEQRSNCRKAWRLEMKELDENKNVTAVENGFLNARQKLNEVKIGEEEQVFKSRLKNRNTFLPPNKMLRIYETKKEREEREKKSKLSVPNKSKPADKEKSRPAENEKSKPSEKKKSSPHEKEIDKPAEKAKSRPSEKEKSRPAEMKKTRPAEKKSVKPGEREKSRPVTKEQSEEDLNPLKILKACKSVRQVAAAPVKGTKRGAEPVTYSRIKNKKNLLID